MIGYLDVFGYSSTAAWISEVNRFFNLPRSQIFCQFDSYGNVSNEKIGYQNHTEDDQCFDIIQLGQNQFGKLQVKQNVEIVEQP